jgi:hypothetical protein
MRSSKTALGFGSFELPFQAYASSQGGFVFQIWFILCPFSSPTRHLEAKSIAKVGEGIHQSI